MIPEFNSNGVLPPILSETGKDRAPYEVDILEFCEKFGFSQERRAILSGLLGLRRDLKANGVCEGFQWINGSFLEHVEIIRERPPNDVDVVSFIRLGNLENQERLLEEAPQLFTAGLAKQSYAVDHYIVQTDCVDGDEASVKNLVFESAYWYSLWAHQRSTLAWKGFVSIPLTSNDADAESWLEGHGESAGESR